MRAVLLAGMLAFSASSSGQAPRFPAAAVWHQDISSAPLHPQSAQMLGALAGLGGWGNGNRFQIDFSLHFRRIAAGEPVALLPLIRNRQTDEYYLPDCEPLGSEVPVTADAAFEGQTGLSCPNGASDCHLLIEREGLLYEVFAGNVSEGQLDATCLAVWDLDRVYPPEGRGEHCTSADAAGFPIAALLPNPDDVAAAAAVEGDLGHAVRFILPNARMASDASLGGVAGRLYVRPASHAGGPSGPASTVPYGVRMRLRGDFPFDGYNAAARALLRTLQRYGIVLSDGGNIALTFSSDRHSLTSWTTLGIGPHVFWNGSAGNRTPVQVGDFEIIDTGARIGETYNCVRTPDEPDGRVFADGFEPGP